MEKSSRRVSHDLNNNHVSKMVVSYEASKQNSESIGPGGLNNPRGLANIAYVESLGDYGSNCGSSVHDLDFGSTQTNPKLGLGKYRNSEPDIRGIGGLRNSFAKKFRCVCSRTCRIAISAALISFGVTILIGGTLIYTLKDIDIGTTRDDLNCTATNCEVLILDNEESWFESDRSRRYNASIGSMLMACGLLAIIIGISILLTPLVQNSGELRNIPLQSRKKLSSVVFFNRKDIEHIRSKLDNLNGDKSDEEPKVSHL